MISPRFGASITSQPGSPRCAQSLNLQRPRKGRNSRIASPIWSSVRWKRPKDWKPGVSMIAVSLVEPVEAREGRGVRAGIARGGELAHARHVGEHQRVHGARLAHAALAHEERELLLEVRQQRLRGVELGRHADDRCSRSSRRARATCSAAACSGRSDLVERDHHRDARRLAGDEAKVQERLAERRLGREQDHDLVHVRGERLLAPLVGAEEEVAARADALDRALRGAGEAHLDEVAAGRVLALALARADDLAAVGELDQELAPEVRDDAALDDDLLFRSRRVVIAAGRRASELEQRVELRRADEVVLRQAVDRVRDVRDAALVVAHQHVGMVVLAVRDPRRRVHERHRLEVVLER